MGVKKMLLEERVSEHNELLDKENSKKSKAKQTNKKGKTTKSEQTEEKNKEIPTLKENKDSNKSIIQKENITEDTIEDAIEDVIEDVILEGKSDLKTEKRGRPTNKSKGIETRKQYSITLLPSVYNAITEEAMLTGNTFARLTETILKQYINSK